MTNCLSCKSGTMLEATTVYTAVLKNCVLILKNVPCVRCEQCGEVLYNTETLEKVESIAAMAEKMASEVSIIDYAKVA